jgi:hypothetical protein
MRIVVNGALILQLHRFEVEDHHGPIASSADKPYGNGVLLWFETDDFEPAVMRAAAMNAHVIQPRHRNPPSGENGPKHWEIWLRDPDGYTIVLPVLAGRQELSNRSEAKERAAEIRACGSEAAGQP